MLMNISEALWHSFDINQSSMSIIQMLRLTNHVLRRVVTLERGLDVGRGKVRPRGDSVLWIDYEQLLFFSGCLRPRWPGRRQATRHLVQARPSDRVHISAWIPVHWMGELEQWHPTGNECWTRSTVYGHFILSVYLVTVLSLASLFNCVVHLWTDLNGLESMQIAVL